MGLECCRRQSQDFDSDSVCFEVQRLTALPTELCVVQPADCAACLANPSSGPVVRDVAARLARSHGRSQIADWLAAATREQLRGDAVDELKPRGPCQHLGELLGVEACDLCGLRGQPVEVFGCDLHGRCTAHKMQRWTMGCAACQNWVPRPES